MCRGSDDQWVALTRTLEFWLWVWESRAKPELCILALGRKLEIASKKEAQTHCLGPRTALLCFILLCGR